MKFPKTTDLEKVKGVAKVLANVSVQKNDNLPFLCYHPYSSYVHIGSPINHNKTYNILEENDYREWVSELCVAIDRAEDLEHLLYLVNTPYYLTFLKYAKNYICERDFGELFTHSWVTEDNPNGDVNVPMKTSCSWFRGIRKEYLMNEHDMEKYNALPDKVTVYRGVSAGREHYGLSWTTDKEKAVWFANRFSKGYLLKVTIDKKYALAYLTSRGEEEVVVDVFNIDKSMIEREEI